MLKKVSVNFFYLRQFMGKKKLKKKNKERKKRSGIKSHEILYVGTPHSSIHKVHQNSYKFFSTKLHILRLRKTSLKKN